MSIDKIEYHASIEIRQTGRVRITAKADYAVRAAVELAAAQPAGNPVKGEQLARSQGIPQNFLENILTELRRAGLVRTRRGADGGYQLAQPAREIAVADVLRAVEGPLAAVQGIQPQDLEYGGAAEHLPELWVAVRASLRSVLEKVTLADLAAGKLPRAVAAKTADPEAWRPFQHH
jgi:Rrf2 family protein